MVEAAIPIAVENREKAFIFNRTPRGRARTDGRHRFIGPPHISLVVVSPVRVHRRVFDMLYGRDQGVSVRVITLESQGVKEGFPGLTALSSKALL